MTKYNPDLQAEFQREIIEYLQEKKRQQERERHEREINEALRKKGYPVPYPRKSRGW